MSNNKKKNISLAKKPKLFHAGGGQLQNDAISLDFPTLVVDNGAGRIKYGWSTDESPLGTMPNAVARIHKTLESVVGDEIDTVPGATSQLRFSRPHDRGYLTNWNVEIDIWRRMFTTILNIDPEHCNLVLTVPPFCPDELLQDTNEVIFEEFGFVSALCKPAAWFSSYHFSQQGSAAVEDESNLFKECNIVVDSGFSFTHSIPFINGVIRPHAAKRVNVGGKLLTNYLKEVISYRQWNFMDEFLLVDEVKNILSFVSQDFVADLSRCQLESPNMRIPLYSCSRNKGTDTHIKLENSSLQQEDEDEFLKKFFVLPDFHHIMKGFVKEDGAEFNDYEQVLSMESERFSIPEVLFHPSDIGINQAGVVEATGVSIQNLSEIEGELCAKNIILTGGNANIPGYRDRFQKDIRQYVPAEWEINVFKPEDPLVYAWQGASLFSRVEQQAKRYHNYAVSRQEYLECGHEVCFRKYAL